MKIQTPVIDWLVAQARKNHSVALRTVVFLMGATLFLVGIPAVVLCVGRLFSQESVLPAFAACFAATACFIVGLPWVLSAVVWQLVFGKGTPVPAIPTKKFLQNGPYRYVRNPMMLGFFVYVLGWALVSNHYGAFIAASLVIAVLLGEIKYIEERELEKRFGAVYREYKKETPFLFPRWRSSSP